MRTVLICAAVAILASGASAQDLTAEQIAAGEARKANEIRLLENDIETLRQEKQAAAKGKNRGLVKALNEKIDDKKDLLIVTKKKPTEWFAIQAINSEKEKAEREAEDAERIRLSGGCPLKIFKGNFFHVDSEAARLGRTMGVLSPEIRGNSTVIMWSIENRSDIPVEAYEVLVEFLNGFDEVVHEQVFQGTRLDPAGKHDAMNGVPEIATAVQVRICAKRAKLINGDIWEKLPEHKQIGILLKKSEGVPKVRAGN